MRKLLLAAAWSVSAALAFSSPVFAQADASMNQIYQAAAAGHLDQAQTMITQVLADHPNSAKAHYVQAELYAKEGKASMGRVELGIAERLSPGLPSFSPRSVQELKSQLGLSAGQGAMTRQVTSDSPRASRFPWGALLIGVAVVALLMMVFRRRTYNTYPSGAGPGMGGTPAGYGPGYGPQPMGGGIGSGIAGGLASGLAVGAGVVAGEELAHHFLDGGRRDGGVIPAADAADAPMSNNDMGGADFGSNDSGSWDDGGGFGGGGGGDDWS